MSSVQSFQFEPTYRRGEEPNDLEEESEEGETEPILARISNTEWCVCGGNCKPMLTAVECFCCQELEDLNQKFDESGLFTFIWCISYCTCEFDTGQQCDLQCVRWCDETCMLT